MGFWSGVTRAAALWLLAFAAHAAHERAPASDWVDWATPAALGEDDSGQDRVALLTDDQVRFDPGKTEWFHRRVSKVLTPAGAEGASEVSVNFAPGFETVVLHGAWVERDGRREDRLPRARVEEMRREEGLDSSVIDGRHTLLLVLDDVRAGDIVDIALSVRGRNPALEHGEAYWSLAVSLPTRERRLRVSHPRGAAFTHRAVGPLPEPVRGTQGTHQTLQWTVRDAQPRREVALEPPWFDAGPAVELGGARGWDEVVEWALPLYAAADDPSIAAVAAELGLTRGKADEADVRRAIAFVQDEIRYTGVEIDAHAYRPYPPAEVLRRRYGDCKDKTTLLVGLLRYLGLAAHPALVDSDDREHIAARLPRATAFDHVIVRFEFAGKTYWIDATATQQRGRLDRLAQADFGRALVLAPGERTLQDIALPTLAGPAIDIVETFDLRDGKGGLATDAAYEIVTRYRGERADNVRRRFAQEGARVMGEGYAEHMAKMYPGLESAATPTLADDAEENEVTVTERYRIVGAWKQDEDDASLKEASFWLGEVDGYVPEDVQPARAAPLWLGRPIDVRQKLVVLLDDGWPEEDEDFSVDDPHLAFERRVENRGNRLEVEGRVRVLATQVTPDAMREFARNMDKIENRLGYTLTLTEGGEASAAASATAVVEALRSGWLDGRFAVLLLAVLATWAAVVVLIKRGGDGVWTGLWRHPRRTARAAIARDRIGEAAVLVCLGALVSTLMDVERVGVLDNNQLMLITLIGRGVLAAVGTLFALALYAGLMAWGGRLFGGRAPVGVVWMGAAWTQVPSILALPVSMLLVGLYGNEMVAMEAPAAVVAVLFAWGTLLLPLFVWSMIVWFPIYSEIMGFSLQRAILATIVLPVGLGLLVFAVVIGIRALAGG